MNKAVAISAFKRLGLTPREADVLLWIARGQSNVEIGFSLHISPRTVKKHLEHIYRKMRVKSRLAASVCATAAWEARTASALKSPPPEPGGRPVVRRLAPHPAKAPPQFPRKQRFHGGTGLEES